MQHRPSVTSSTPSLAFESKALLKLPVIALSNPYHLVWWDRWRNLFWFHHCACWWYLAAVGCRSFAKIRCSYSGSAFVDDVVYETCYSSMLVVHHYLFLCKRYLTTSGKKCDIIILCRFSPAREEIEPSRWPQDIKDAFIMLVSIKRLIGFALSDFLPPHDWYAITSRSLLHKARLDSIEETGEWFFAPTFTNESSSWALIFGVSVLSFSSQDDSDIFISSIATYRLSGRRDYCLAGVIVTDVSAHVLSIDKALCCSWYDSSLWLDTVLVYLKSRATFIIHWHYSAVPCTGMPYSSRGTVAITPFASLIFCSFGWLLLPPLRRALVFLEFLELIRFARLKE